jgi:hypothetical protein
MEHNEDLLLHIFLDGSCMEVFTGSGQVLTTRVYRGKPPAGVLQSGLEVFAEGGSCQLVAAEAFELGSCWSKVEDEPLTGRRRG